ncbi:hypothetical protein IMSAGC012_01696 [Lachnospiraceae bacterium]|jgi:hypothetical protein|nr:hypothetical protein [Eubacterium sp.]GFI26575.1 hypothetical protein IMSAGC012_01696 [Lachnospiraceae bacterium]
MNRKTYRLCLIVLIVSAVVSGVFYYRFSQEKHAVPKEATFVSCPLTGSDFA